MTRRSESKGKADGKWPRKNQHRRAISAEKDNRLTDGDRDTWQAKEEIRQSVWDYDSHGAGVGAGAGNGTQDFGFLAAGDPIWLGDQIGREEILFFSSSFEEISQGDTEASRGF